MSNLLKDIYSPSFYDQFSDVLVDVVPSFDKSLFMNMIYENGFESFELKERMKHTARVLNHFLPIDFKKSTVLIMQIIEHLRSKGIKESSIEFMFFPEYISMYGINDYDSSVAALEQVTQFTSCEFAVRPFILKYKEKMMAQMLAWSNHSSKKVRRLASEGSRPRLPWAMALPFLKKDPGPVIPILENLRQDSCESVRRSVANNLNDIAKDNPATVVEIAKKWRGIDKETDAIVKHACRTLLKNAHPEIMRFYGLDGSSFGLNNFVINTPLVKMGDSLDFTFSVENLKGERLNLRLEYGIYYRKSNGKTSRKVFKISERLYQPGEKSLVDRKHSFRLITTRTYYSGEHQLSIILNGEEKGVLGFELVR